MSILIKGMKMPTNCWDCPIRNSKPCPCKGPSTALEYVTERHADCPLVPVPEHGRLIDADALLTSKGVGTQIAGWGKMFHESAIEYAPTIIPADHIGGVNEMVADKEGEG